MSRTAKGLRPGATIDKIFGHVQEDERDGQASTTAHARPQEREGTPRSYTMFASLVRWSRTTYRGARGSGAGRSGKTDSRSSSASRPTDVAAAHAGRTFKRAQRGLYDGRILQFGNTIPNSRHKTARRWEPNVQRKTLWSETLQQWVSTRVATSAMRSIRKHGGLDQYLAQTKDTHLGEFGRTLRERVARALRDKRLMNEA